MGLLPTGLFRSRDSRPQGLPLYEKPTRASSGKDRYSDDDISSPDGSDDDEYDYDGESAASSPRSGRAFSRQSSGTAASTSYMLPKRAPGTGHPVSAFEQPRRRLRASTASAAVRAHIYRLPQKVIRYLCTALIMTIVVLIITLVRASQLENRRLAIGGGKGAATPPAWESFDFLTRYYGGVRNLVPLKENVPQYPREEDEQPYGLGVNDTSANAAGTGDDAAPKVHLHAAAAAAAAALHKADKAPLPPSAAFDTYKGYVKASDPDHISPCFIDDKNTVSVPPLRYYEGRPNGFPQNIMGSYELLSLPEDICFDRFGRFGPYGYGYSVRSGGLGVGEYGESEGAEAVWAGDASKVDYRKVDWAGAQQRCYNANARRFKPAETRHAPVNGLYVNDGAAPLGKEAPAPIHHAPRDAPAEATSDVVSEPTTNSTDSVPVVHAETSAAPATPPPQGDIPRTAVVIRCWDEFIWREEDIMNLRALIVELSLASGGRYDVHLLVQVKNDAKFPIWADDGAYRAKIDSVIPPEFRSIVTLWTETQMLSLYQGIHDLYTRGPGLPVHGVYRGLQMAMQHFSYNHPEYEYFWQWEMDIRYTGHHLDLFTKTENWAKEQPRKGLWERNSRFYIPSVHGSWEDFRQMARVQTEAGLAGADNIWSGVPGAGPNAGPGANKVAGEQTVWGPVRPADPEDWFEPENDPVPPTSYEKDRYTWGVGEEADLITLNPIFDPEGTTWLLADDITGYNETAERAGGQTSGKPQRRAQIITASRMSRRMLHTMHRETAFKKHHAFSEMWPATAALQHGYKAVYVPHPVYVDREWPTQYMARTFNGGRNGASGGSRMSVFGQREHNFLGLTWYYNAGFSPNLYRRWLGLKVNGDGGADFEENADVTRNDSTVSNMRGGEGRMCLPAMLLHPIKGVELPVESHANEDYNKPDSDLNPGS
ncbi:hypothetical protein HMPREF1624_01182 [Sporothrix schenckii ATCC 58251]|uniref:Major facilitator superfamily transporter n=1 Tax=Sporothrix schenckii (strain ATCC 58251 / de Perez 2211183) TaxID=1391915 RepID=U7Q4V1_SPOS1|nr:hypothetical protein HMPREF1624_01182 [Sporothrix schenckii ATCC 58251]